MPTFLAHDLNASALKQPSTIFPSLVTPCSLVSFTAVIRVVTQHSWEERCVMTLVMAAKKTCSQDKRKLEVDIRWLCSFALHFWYK